MLKRFFQWVIPFFTYVINYVKERYIVAVWSLWIVLLVELLSRTHVGETFRWSFFHIPGLLLNILIVSCLILLITAVIGSTRIAYWIVTLLVFVLSFISGIKLKMLGVPLLPWDFVLASEGGDMAQYLTNIVDFTLITGIVLFLAGSYVLLYRLSFSRIKLFWKERTAVAVLSVLLLALIYTDKPIPVRTWLHVESQTWSQGDNVRTNGFVLTTVMNVNEMFAGKSKNYDREAVAAFATQKSVQTFPENSVRPNIIIVLSEAFWDPTIIKSITYDRDPIPFFHSLQAKYSSGWMLSPQYGGGTANVEFEVLTGNSMRFLPQGSIPYNQFITHEVDSLASILTRQDYTSTAINPFYSWFFNSKKVYENFGFEKFIPIEYFNPVYQGPYIADDETANNVIETTKRSKGVDFVFTNTMENHFHFYPGKFKENTFTVSGATGSAKGMLETLAQGLHGADTMLKKLVEYYDKSGEPTIIVFFGDHLPYLGDNYEAFKDTQYITGENDPDFLNKMYRVPVVVWNNYLPERKDTLDISPSFLGPYILELAQKKGTYYTDFLRDLSAKTPVIPPKNYYEAMNISEEDMKLYESLQYDILFGDRTGYGDLKGKIINPQYKLGYEPIVINHVTLEQIKATDATQQVLSVSGTYLPHQTVVYLNGKPLSTTWEKDGLLKATVPEELLKAETVEIVAKIVDSKETVVGQSNAYSLKLK